MSDADPSFWEDLLEYIDDRRVIPVVGVELLRIAHEGREIGLSQWLAERLAARLGVPADDLPEDDALNAIICRHLARGGRREDVYPRLRSILGQAPLPTPEPLRKLARVRHFTLFVSTSFDTLLEQALEETRPAAAPGAASGTGPAAPAVQSIAYAPNQVQDLPAEMRRLDRPTVYHLFGRLSSVPDSAVTEEDTLEFLYALQTEKKRPELLFDELKNNHLLLIGNRFPDWLARFFIRLAKGGRLSGQRDGLEVVADHGARHDKNLVLFLRSFSYRTQIYARGGAVEFVDELLSRYEQRHPPAPIVPKPAVGKTEPTSPGAEMPEGAVFISYARQDVAAAQALRDALESAGVDVWLDKRELEAGDLYDPKIRRNIKACSLFVPLISASTQARLEGYFRLEWRLAAERSMQIVHTVPFILPVAVDATPEADALVPDCFMDAQWTRLPGGKATSEFATRVVKLLRDYRKRQRGLA